MLGRAWSVKERLIEFCRLNRAVPTVRENTLTPNDWQQIDRLHNALHVFELTTMTTQGTHKHLFEWYPTLQFTLDYTSKFSAEFKEEALIDERFSYLSSCCDHAWLKAEKYWKLADEMPIVYAAVVLNPTLKMGWFEDQWLDGTDEQQGYILQVRNLVKDLWTTALPLPPPLKSPPPPLKRPLLRAATLTITSELLNAARSLPPSHVLMPSTPTFLPTAWKIRWKHLSTSYNGGLVAASQSLNSLDLPSIHWLFRL
jgi:hypothetical protein